jgi:glycosyltransferase involved in cell wall biosynthesis
MPDFQNGGQARVGNCIIVVPCYNEAARFEGDQFRLYLSGSPDKSILFVNDGSTDGTLALLERLQAESPMQVGVLHKERNAGKAEAVRSGLLHTLRQQGVAYVGFWDADLATPLNAIDDLFAILSSRPEIEMVFGSRVKLLGRDIERRPARHYLGRVFATCASLVLRLPIYDTQCGAKLFRVTPDLVQVLQRPFSSRWIFDVELIARFLQLHTGAADGKDLRQAIYEFPLYRWKDVPGSKVRPRDFFTAIRDLLMIRKQYLSHRTLGRSKSVPGA